MADQKIQVDLTANSSSVEQALQKLAAGLDRTVDKLNNVEKVAKSGTKAAADGMSNGATQAMKFVGAIAGVGGAVGGVLAVVNQLKREYDNLISRQKGAADTQLGFEQQLAQTVRNAGGVLGGQQVRDMSLKLAEGASADPAKAAAVLGSAFSARGITNEKQAEEVRAASEAVMRFAPELSAEDAAMMAGTTIDITKRTGMTPRQAIGLIQQTSGMSRTTTLKGVAENVMPGAMAMEQLGGGSMETNAALMAALTQGIVDPEGAVSRTAGITFAKELRERFPQLKDTEERLKKLQSDPKLQKAFLEGGRIGGKQFGAAEIGRGQATASVESLIRGSGTAFEAFEDGKRQLGDRAVSGQTFDKMQREVDSVTFASRLKRTFEGATKQQQISDSAGGQTSITREGLAEFLKAAGQSDLSQRIESLIFEGNTLAGGVPMDVAAQRLRGGASSIRSPARVTDTGGNMGFSPNTRFAEPKLSEGESRNATAMEKLASQLDGLSAEIKANTKATAENTKVTPTKKDVPTVTPAAAQTPKSVPSAALGRK